jgi:hypothetical protein
MECCCLLVMMSTIQRYWCLYMHMYICKYLHMYVCIFMNICIHTYKYMCIHIVCWLWWVLFRGTDVYVCICKYLHMYVCIFMNIYIHTYKYMCIHIYMLSVGHYEYYSEVLMSFYICMCTYVYICIYVDMSILYRCIYIPYIYICVYIYLHEHDIYTYMIYVIYICTYRDLDGPLLVPEKRGWTLDSSVQMRCFRHFVSASLSFMDPLFLIIIDLFLHLCLFGWSIWKRI